jgi:hypothetical protein
MAKVELTTYYKILFILHPTPQIDKKSLPHIELSPSNHRVKSFLFPLPKKQEKRPLALSRLQIDPEAWRQLSTGFEREFSQLIGREASVQHACDLLGRQWAKGAARCRALFAP